MSSTFVDRENQQWRSTGDKFTPITLKGIDTQEFVDGEVLAYDKADDTYIKYTGAAAQLAVAILSLGVGETIVLAVADTLEPPATACIGGEVIVQHLTLPVDIDDRPNAAEQSVRLQLREVGIIVRDINTLNENHLS